jgi:hypothetical protein
MSISIPLPRATPCCLTRALPLAERRVLNKFGVETVKRGNRRIEAAIDSTGAR